MTTLAAPTEPGVYHDIPEGIYHADQGSLSMSGAKVLMQPAGPAKFKYQREHPRKPKKVWDFGHVAHHLLLGKGAEIAVLDPEIHGLKKDGTVSSSPASTDTWKDASAEARARGATPIHIDLHRVAEEMAAKVREHPVAGSLFEQGEAEVSLYAPDPVTGVMRRGRTDWLTDVDERVWCVDYKTDETADPEQLERKWYLLGYYMQFAWYVDLLKATGRAENPAFVFVVQEKEPPFEVNVIEYDAAAYRKGAAQNRRALDLYAECQRTGIWPGYPLGIKTLSVPAWAATQSAPVISDWYDADE